MGGWPLALWTIYFFSRLLQKSRTTAPGCQELRGSDVVLKDIIRECIPMPICSLPWSGEKQCPGLSTRLPQVCPGWATPAPGALSLHGFPSAHHLHPGTRCWINIPDSCSQLQPFVDFRKVRKEANPTVWPRGALRLAPSTSSSLPRLRP